MDAVAQTISQLSRRLRELQAQGRPAARVVPLAGVGLEPLLPEGRLPAGELVEMLAAEPGCGAWTLALTLARRACGGGRGLVVADAARSFYPPAARRWGFGGERLLLLRPATPVLALAALGQALRSPAVGAVLGEFERIGSTDYRRLQLAAETGGGVGILVRPAAARSVPSFAAHRWLLRPLPSEWGQRRLAVEPLRLRGQSGRPLLLEIDDATGDVRAVPSLAGAAPLACGAGTAG